MGLFSNKQVYADKWSVKSVAPMSADDAALFNKAIVVPSEFGMSVEFHMVSGGKCYIPVDTECVVQIGEELNPMSLEVVILERLGDEDIERIRVVR